MSSTLMLLRLQQEHIGIEFRQHRGVVLEETAPAFKWEAISSLASVEDFEATLLSPSRQGASTFLPEGDHLAVLSLGNVGLLHAGAKNATENSVSGTGYVGIGRGSHIHLDGCDRDSCVLGMQRVPLFRRPSHRVPRGATCFRVMVGPTAEELQPMASSSRPLLCMRAQRISAVLPVNDKGNTTVYLVWDPSVPRGGESTGGQDTGDRAASDSAQYNAALMPAFTCVAALTLPDLQVRAMAGVDWAATAVYDSASASIITIGHTATSGTLVAHSLDPLTLRPKRRYRLPLSTAWSVQLPGVSDGFLLLLGAEPPFTGTAFAIDLGAEQVYMLSPPEGESDPPVRMRLPKSKHVEELVNGGAMGLLSPSLTAEDGPCNIVAGPSHVEHDEGAAV